MPHREINLVQAALIVLLIHANCITAQHYHYEPEDWQYIPATATITSASEGPDGIYFSTFDGLLFFDYYNQGLDHLPQINMGLPSHHLYHVYHDPSTDGLWVVYEDGIAFRMRTDETWRFVPFLALPDHFRGRDVTRVGGTFDGIWIDLGGVYTLLNSFTGEFIHRDLAGPDNPVAWNTSQAEFLEPPDLLGWITTGQWSSAIREFLGPGYLTAVPTFVFQDRYNRYWYGTDIGTLFRGDPSTRRLEELQAGIATKPVITIYRDGDRIWFADNIFRREGVRPLRREGYFLSAWDERISSWRYYSSLSSEVIRDAGVNAILRVGRQMWLATMNGIVLLETRTGAWGFIGSKAGLRDQAIWDLERHQDEIFAATIRGIDRISPSTRLIIPEDSSSVSPMVEVYCLLSAGQVLYAGTADGIYAYQSERPVKWWRTSALPATSMWGDGGDMFVVANNYVYQRGSKEKDFTLTSISLSGEAKILEIKGYGLYIWLATSQGALLYDRREQRLFTFGGKEGLPSEVVYAIEPSADWVWFLTKDGVVRFNWKTYFE
ncbi:MAG: hypothetical protein ACETWG_13320 [Candidatus Neomarinimicrobiota bacterium]